MLLKTFAMSKTNRIWFQKDDTLVDFYSSTYFCQIQITLFTKQCFIFTSFWTQILNKKVKINRTTILPPSVTVISKERAPSVNFMNPKTTVLFTSLAIILNKYKDSTREVTT